MSVRKHIGRRLVSFILTTSISFLFCNPVKAQLSFVDMSDSLNVDFSYGTGWILHGVPFGGGVSFFDFNQDGWDDLTFASNDSVDVQFFVNDSGTFRRISPLINFKAQTKQINWIDSDNDGDYDLFVTSIDSGNRLYENTGNLVMVDVTPSSNISTSIKRSMGANWGDYNRDGLPDLYISNYEEKNPIHNELYKNVGNNEFIDVTESAAVADTILFSMASAFMDYNNDRWPDIYATSDFTTYPNIMYKNNGDGIFGNVASSTSTMLYMDAMCTTVGDYNNDGFLDIYLTNTPPNKNVLLHNLGNNRYRDTAAAMGVLHEAWAWGSVWFDAENDGDLDLYVSSDYKKFKKRSTFFEQDSDTFRVPATAGFLGDTMRSYSNAVGDFNNDGLADVVVSNQDRDAYLWQNQATNVGNYVKVKLEGYDSNRDGIGSRIEVHSSIGMRMRYTLNGEGLLAQNSGTQIIGIDTATVIDSLVVKWVNGHNDVLYNIPANQTVEVIEGSTRPIRFRWYANDNYTYWRIKTICLGDTVKLGTKIRYDEFAWSTGDTTSSIYVDSAGTYTVQARVGNGPWTLDSFEVVTVDWSDFSIGPADTTMCPGTYLSSNKFAFEYTWNTGYKWFRKPIFEEGTYWLEIKQGYCIASDTIDVKLHDVEDLDLGEDTVICEGTSMILDAGPNWSWYLWSDSSSQQTFSVSDSGEYNVLVRDSNSCYRFDRIVVGVDECLGLEEQKGLVWKIFPNPASSDLTILKNDLESWEYELIDMKGSVIYKGLFAEPSLVIDVRPLVGGIYNLRFVNRTSGVIVERKILITLY